jgi:hypothetical protein
MSCGGWGRETRLGQAGCLVRTPISTAGSNLARANDAHDLARRRDRLGGVQLARDAALRLEHGRDGNVIATSVMVTPQDEVST